MFTIKILVYSEPGLANYLSMDDWALSGEASLPFSFLPFSKLESTFKCKNLLHFANSYCIFWNKAAFFHSRTILKT